MKQLSGVVVVLATAAVGVVTVGFNVVGSSATWIVVGCATLLPGIAARNSYKKGRRIGGRECAAWHALALAMAFMSPVYLLDALGLAFLEYSFVTAAYLSGAVAAVTIPLPTAGPFQRIITSLDSVSIGVVVATATFWVLSTSDLGTTSVTGWVVVNSAIMAMIGYIALRRGQSGIEWPIVWLAIATGGYLGGTLITAISSTGYEIGGPSDYLYLIGMMAFALAPTVRDRRANEQILRPVRWAHVVVPYIFVGALTLILIAYLAINWRDDPTGTVVVLGLVLTMSIAVARQLAMIAAQRRKIEVEQRGVIATVSHELRTPLTSIVGFLDMLDPWDAFPDDEKIEMVTLMRGQSHVLARVVDDLVSVARSEIDSTALSRDELHVADLLGYAISAVPELDRVSATFDIETGMKLHADRERIIQVATNFLSNAVNYGGGKIAIVAYQAPQGGVLEIHDNGPGVPDIHQLVIWERFERGPRRQSSIPGSGIGLAVARGIARSHGGDAHYRASEILGGACFSVTIPATTPSADPDEQLIAAGL